MKISNKLHQFAGERALLIVTGKQGAEFYFASDGLANIVHSFEIKSPRFSDREGFLGRGGRGGAGISGAVREKQDFTKEFLRLLKESTKRLMKKHKVNAAYIYVPQYLMKQVKGELMKTLDKTYVMSFRGNYLKTPMNEVVKMVKTRTARRAARKHVVLTTGEAAKVLRRRAI